MKLLYISAYAPYDGILHAGGKTHNYYLKELAKKFEIKLITYVQDFEAKKMDLDRYGIDHKYIFYPNTIFCKVKNKWSRINPLNRYGGFIPCFFEKEMNNTLIDLFQCGYKPDLIILEWTEILVLLPIIKKYYSNIPVFTIEVDVAFLGKERIANKYTNKIAKRIAQIKYQKIKKNELENLKIVDKIFTNNEKDKAILESYGFGDSKIDILTPYYDDYSKCQYRPANKNILFFGAMNRTENSESVLWFIDNVMPLLDEDFTFVVVGNHPTKEVLKKQSKRVLVTGFVNDVGPYFENSLCFVSPLILGAGVKVKVIEALSSGIPVICNQVSIEGINAIDKKDYIHCENAEEYAKAIKKVYEDSEFAHTIGLNGKKLISENYSYEKDCSKLKELIQRTNKTKQANQGAIDFK